MKFYVGVTDHDWLRFLLHSPDSAIAGGGFFVHYSALPLSLTWEAFEPDPVIGCVVLTEPFFLFFRADLHRLFDCGLLTITDDYRVEVSQRIRETYNNGKEYYRFHGQTLLEEVLPERPTERPSMEYLSWHQNAVFR